MVAMIRKIVGEASIAQWLTVAVQAPAAVALILIVWQTPAWLAAIQGGYESNATQLEKAADSFRSSVQMLIDDRKTRDKGAAKLADETSITKVQ